MNYLKINLFVSFLVVVALVEGNVIKDVLKKAIKLSDKENLPPEPKVYKYGGGGNGGGDHIYHHTTFSVHESKPHKQPQVQIIELEKPKPQYHIIKYVPEKQEHHGVHPHLVRQCFVTRRRRSLGKGYDDEDDDNTRDDEKDDVVDNGTTNVIPEEEVNNEGELEEYESGTQTGTGTGTDTQTRTETITLTGTGYGDGNYDDDDDDDDRRHTRHKIKNKNKKNKRHKHKHGKREPDIKCIVVYKHHHIQQVTNKDDHNKHKIVEAAAAGLHDNKWFDMLKNVASFAGLFNSANHNHNYHHHRFPYFIH